MKKLILILFFIFTSCNQSKYEYIGQEIIDGKVSAIKEGSAGRAGSNPRIWIQNTTETKELSIPFEYANKWKVGDSCLLIIQKYKEINNDSE